MLHEAILPPTMPRQPFARVEIVLVPADCLFRVCLHGTEKLYTLTTIIAINNILGFTGVRQQMPPQAVREQDRIRIGLDQPIVLPDPLIFVMRNCFKSCNEDLGVKPRVGRDTCLRQVTHSCLRDRIHPCDDVVSVDVLAENDLPATYGNCFIARVNADGVFELQFD